MQSKCIWSWCDRSSYCIIFRSLCRIIRCDFSQIKHTRRLTHSPRIPWQILFPYHQTCICVHICDLDATLGSYAFVGFCCNSTAIAFFINRVLRSAQLHILAAPNHLHPHRPQMILYFDVICVWLKGTHQHMGANIWRCGKSLPSTHFRVRNLHAA